MSKNKILVISNFPNNSDEINGQSLKAKFIIDKFKKNDYKVSILNYFNYKKKIITLFLKLLLFSLKNKNIMILPDKGGLPFFAKFYSFFLFRRNKIYYSVVGGWLPNFVEQNNKIVKYLAKFKGILVENEDMLNNLAKYSLSNIFVVENFKEYNRKILNINHSDFKNTIGHFCVLSRLDPDKGISEAIEAISLANKLGYKIDLDIYGPIKESYKQVFVELIKNNSNCVFYKGIADPKNANIILNKYYMQLFLTKLSTEGIPGSIIDSFAGGTPIIFYNWNKNFNMIKNEISGLRVSSYDIKTIVEQIIYSMKNPDLVYKMRLNCLTEYNKYDSDIIFDKILKIINNNY